MPVRLEKQMQNANTDFIPQLEMIVKKKTTKQGRWWSFSDVD